MILGLKAHFKNVFLTHKADCCTHRVNLGVMKNIAMTGKEGQKEQHPDVVVGWSSTVEVGGGGGEGRGIRRQSFPQFS